MTYGWERFHFSALLSLLNMSAVNFNRLHFTKLCSVLASLGAGGGGILVPMFWVPRG